MPSCQQPLWFIETRKNHVPLLIQLRPLGYTLREAGSSCTDKENQEQPDVHKLNVDGNLIK